MDYLKTDLGQRPDGSALTRWQYSGQIQGIDDLQSIKSHNIDFDNLKLNSSQVEQIKQLNQQINSIGDLEEPPRKDVDERIRQINQEIDSLFIQIKDCTNQIQKKYDEREEYIQRSNPDVANYETLQGQLFELLSKRNIIKQEIKINEKLLSSLKSKSKRPNQNQLQIQNEQFTVENNLRGQYESLIQINDEIAQYNDKKDSIKDQKQAVKAETKQFSDEIKLLKDNILSLKTKIQQKKDEKDQIIRDYNEEFDNYRRRYNQKCKLEIDMNNIFLEASENQ